MFDTRAGRRLTRFNSDPMPYAGLPNASFSYSSDNGLTQSTGPDFNQSIHTNSFEDSSWTRPRARPVDHCAVISEQSVRQHAAPAQYGRQNRSFSIDAFEPLVGAPSLQTWSSYGSTEATNMTVDTTRSWSPAVRHRHQHSTSVTPTAARSAAPAFSKNPFRRPTQDDPQDSAASWGLAVRPSNIRSQTTPGAYGRNPFQLHGHIKQTSQDLRHLQTQQLQHFGHRRGRTQVFSRRQRRDYGWSRPVNTVKSFSEGDAQSSTCREIQSPRTPASACSTQTCPTAWPMPNTMASLSMSDVTVLTPQTGTQEIPDAPDAWDWSTGYSTAMSTNAFPKRTLSLDLRTSSGMSIGSRDQWSVQASTIAPPQVLTEDVAEGFNAANDMLSTTTIDKGLGIDTDSDGSLGTGAMNLSTWQRLSGGSQPSMASSFGMDSSEYFVTGAGVDTSMSAASDMSWTGMFEPQVSQAGVSEVSGAGHLTSRYVQGGDMFAMTEHKRSASDESSQWSEKRQRLL